METKILVVVDVQTDFESGSLGTTEAQAAIPSIVNKVEQCGNEGYIVIATQDTHDGDYLETNEGKHLPVIHTVQGTAGWDIVPAVKEALDKYQPRYVRKNTFGSLDLSREIKNALLNAGTIKAVAAKADKGKGLKIVVIGFCTDICVITNVLLLKTAFPEAEIIVDSKCCAGVTPEAHEAALTVMRSCQVTVE